MSEKCRSCCKSRFPLLIKIFLARWCDSRINMWGTSSPREKLIGDFANGLGAILNSEHSLASFLSKKSSPSIFGLLQQYRHKAVNRCGVNVWILLEVKCSREDHYEPCISSDSDARGCRQRAVGDD